MNIPLEALSAKSWRIAILTAIVAIGIALLVSYYVHSARQHLGADYTALVGNIVRAQQTTPQLDHALESFIDEPIGLHLRQIRHTLWLSSNYLDQVSHGLSQHSQLYRDTAYLGDDFTRLRGQIITLEEQAEAALVDRSLLPELQRLSMDIEATMAWTYSELNAAVHSAAGRQRFIMQRLSWAVTALVVAVMLVALALLAAVLRLQRQRNTLKMLMLTDELTGLYNRRHLVDAASRELNDAQRHQQPLSLLLLDLDYFKHVNDTYGHPAGDDVLRKVSQQLRNISRATDIVARIGGEEFCVLMPNTTVDDAESVAERIRHAIALEPLTHLGANLQQTVSIGVTTSLDGSHSFEKLYSLADQALYQAKELGRNRVECVLPPHSSSERQAILTNSQLDI
ncbi:GGDEF domain-containing protein [Halomonas vilamensis]|uniref:diguanylate cyclase n=1 Tax=Vreelandella vilamensis TaxID=531309 RepID=A0ABU1H7Z2_9GAMM|nr:GGDEF domain-containing protein [Halomonas vilamensis]MDR5899638.1 GGDEF domain-containing protein [Halomonas vilamensis]